MQDLIKEFEEWWERQWPLCKPDRTTLEMWFKFMKERTDDRKGRPRSSDKKQM